MFLFSSSSFFSSYTHSSSSVTTTSRQRCSLVLLGVPVLSIILVNFISFTEGAIDTTKQLNYYQSLQRHLTDFTIKDDPEDLLALPSDSDGASVVVVAPPLSMTRNLPITQYAKTTANDREQQTQKPKKSRSNRLQRHRKQAEQQTEDNVAQESFQGGAAVAYAKPPPSFSPSARILHDRIGSESNDNVAQESYQSAAYAPPPPPASSSPSSSSAASEKSYDQYPASSSSSSSTSITKDNQAQESYQSNSYAPPPSASREYPQYHRGSITSPAATDEKTKDSQAQESYQSRSYAPPPSSSPPPQALPLESSKSYYDQYQRSSSSGSISDNHAQESYQPPLSYAPPPSQAGPTYLSPEPAAASGKSGTADNLAQESYRGTMSYAPPPPPPPSSPGYYPPSHYNSPNHYQGSYYPQSDVAPAPPPPVQGYYDSHQAAPSHHHQHNYYPYGSSQNPNYSPHSSYQSEPVTAAAGYAPYPATTPAPAARAQHHRHLTYYGSPKPTVLQPANSRSSPHNKNNVAAASVYSPSLAHHPHLTSIDKYQQEQKQQQQQTAYSSPASSHSPISGYARETFEFSPAPPGPPPPPPASPPGTLSSPPVKDQSIAEDSLLKQQKLLRSAIGTGLDIYKLATTSPVDLIVQAISFLASLSIPKDHYLNVVSFVGVYLFMSILFYGQDDKLQKCEDDGDYSSKEWHYHVGRRFVPAIKRTDEKLQKKFLKLFKGLHLQEKDDDDDDGSSEEQSHSVVKFVNEMCPRGSFFYSMAPMHLEARMQVQRILVAQPSPEHVYAAAKALLYKHKVHPKVWYLGLIAASLERPDMTGFKLAHPIDAIPDWFIPADLIKDEMDKYRSHSLARSRSKNRIRRAASGNSTILTTTPKPSTTTSTTTLSPSSSSTVTVTTRSSNSSTTTKITRRPLLYTRRSTTTYRPPDFSFFSGESNSFENFVLDGTPPYLIENKYHEYEETINNSVQKYQQINKESKGKYKPKKKENKSKPSKEETKQQDQDASNSASAEQDTDTSNAVDNDNASSAIDNENASNALDMENASNLADNSGSTELDNLSSSGGTSATSAQQNALSSSNDGIVLDDDEAAAVIAPAPPSVRPSHLTSSHHNAIKVGDLTVVVGSGPSLLGDSDIPIYSLDDGGKKKKYSKNSHHREKGHRHKKGHKKGKGKGDDDGKCIIVDGKVGRDNGVENKLWYFREDMMVSQNHWYWHLTHPVNATRHPDRRAELFFFTHRQFLARYNSERMSNGLHRMIHMTNIGPGGILIEPYHSHLADVASGKYWTPRYPKRLLRDIRHIHNPDIATNIMLKDAATTYDRLIKSVQTGLLISQRNGLVPIRNTKGIEPLANTVEATELSENPLIYNAFGLHNMGHLIIGLVEDPHWNYRKTPGVMAEVATSMRDPIFYNYHALIDNIFERHKETLPPYKVEGGEYPLLWRGVKILDMEMISKGNGPLNQLRTFWTKKKFELAPSVDGSTAKEEEHAQICAVHLAHEPFTFKITIERKPCAVSKSGKGTIRIFIAPRFDEKNRRLHLREQRRLMIQLDAFQAKLRVGRNIITRRSHDSSLTQPWTKHLKDYKEKSRSGAADFCGCGWPQHLYIPKGNRHGMPFDLFVMVTNYDLDHVPNDHKDLEFPETCNSPYLFCGHPRRRYPDARPMGYPWDRPPYKTPIPCATGHTFAAVVCKSFNLVAFKPLSYLEDFTAKAENMKSIVFDIKHIDKLVKSYHRRH